jgi:hypothetical protein
MRENSDDRSSKTKYETSEPTIFDFNELNTRIERLMEIA